jgi:hypothetical protein
MKQRRACCSSRRHFLASQALGIGGLALSWLMNEERLAAQTRPDLEKPVYDLTPKQTPSEPQARAMISLWMQGGPSHVDLCDPKPELARLDGKDIPAELPSEVGMPNNPTTKTVLAPPWKFRKHGESGMDWSQLLPHISEISDDITLIRSMYAPTANNHLQSTRAFQRADKSNRLGNSDRPSLGSWITYALGSEAQSLQSADRRNLQLDERRAAVDLSGDGHSAAGTADRQPRYSSVLEGGTARQRFETAATDESAPSGTVSGTQ